jgi:hypothetical protein
MANRWASFSPDVHEALLEEALEVMVRDAALEMGLALND